MISIREALEIHKILIDNYGGTHGIRDLGSLESALRRPLQQFENKDLYPSILQKAAALVQSILVNHPFIDGNKRLGYTLLRYLLLQNGLDIDANQEENTIPLSLLHPAKSTMTQL